MEFGYCKYGDKCQFAHGKEQLRYTQKHPKYKTEKCKSFWTTGTCRYGTRCKFLHDEKFDESGQIIEKETYPTTPTNRIMPISTIPNNNYNYYTDYKYPIYNTAYKPAMINAYYPNPNSVFIFIFRLMNMMVMILLIHILKWICIMIKVFLQLIQQQQHLLILIVLYQKNGMIWVYNLMVKWNTQ